MQQLISHLLSRITELERRVANQMRHGTVAEVDTKKQRVRLKLGKDDQGQDFLGPWVPYGQQAGALKIHAPPSVGQTMTMFSPGGDFEQAVAHPLTWSDQNPSPSEKGDKPGEEEVVMTLGKTKLEFRDGQMKITADGTTFDFKKDGYDQQGGKMKHNNQKIDGSHRHKDTMPGSGFSGVPEDDA